MRRAGAILLASALSAGATVATAQGEAVPEVVLAQTTRTDQQQTFPTGTPVPAPPTVLVVNLERVFSESRFGQRVRADLVAAQQDLIAENEAIQTELQTEERSLAERRATMAVDAFRAEADAFDTRVQEIRREQDAKEVALQQVLDEGRTEFRAAVEPIVARLMVEMGATVVLYHTSVYVAVATVDITGESVAALDIAVGDGRAPDDVPDPAIPDPADPDLADPDPAPTLDPLSGPDPLPGAPVSP